VTEIKMPSYGTTRRTAFTLVELLVVISIISLLLSLLAPTLTRSRELTRRALCANNLHQIHGAVTTYSSERRDWLPTMNDGSSTNPQNNLTCTHWSRWYYIVGMGYNNLGNLRVSGHLTGGEMLYCPSQKNEAFTYEYYSPWPKSVQPGPTAANGVRLAYGFNPYVKDPAANWKRLYQHTTSFPAYKILLFDILEGRSAIAHNDPGWNILTGDGGCRYVVEETIPDVEMRDPSFGDRPHTSFENALYKLEVAGR